jgi:beta-glucosidase
VLVITGGSPIALGEAYDWVQAALWAGYPGEEGGTALAKVLFGDVSPSGKLTVTTPRSWDQLPPFEDYSMEGRTYRYAQWEPEFPFGFGLSYTKFSYSDLKVTSERVKPGESVWVRVNVANAGEHDGDEIVQLYLKDVKTSGPAPFMSLVGFQRITLRKGEEKVVELEIPADAMALVLEDGSSKIEPGEFMIHAGGCIPGKRSLELGASEGASGSFRVE